MNEFIQILSSTESEHVCRNISEDLSEWFGIPEANEKYAKGVKERLSFGYFVDESCVGMLSLEFPFKNNANIYWMAVKKNWHHKGIGKALLNKAELICRERNIESITVETLSSKENDSYYLKTLNFYLKEGFKQLFELNTYGPSYTMVYLSKILSPWIFQWIDLTHPISDKIPTWEGDCGFRHIDLVKYEDNITDCKFLIQKIETMAGIGTHMDAPSHCFPHGKSINELAIENLISPCIVINVSNEMDANYIIELEIIKNFEKRYGNAWKDAFVIFYTGWDNFWNQPEKYRNDLRFPSLSKEVALYLVKEGIHGIGIDTLSPDLPESGYPVHQIVLGAGKYIVENIANASLLPVIGSYIFVLPIPIIKGSESPIRLLALLQK